MKDVIKVGQLVCSTLGRDKGKVYVVIGLPEINRLLVADGIGRKIDKAKKKNIKHLKELPYFAEEVAELVKEKRLTNGTIARIISEHLQSERVFDGEE